MTSYLEGSYQEVSATTAITPDSFGNSTLDFNFSIGNPNVLYIGKSFFRITATINRGTEVSHQPLIRDGLAFSSDPCGSLFSECYFQMGGNDISKINNFHAQSSILKQRLLNSHQYFKSIGQLPYIKPDMNERILDVSNDLSTQTGITYAENEIYPLYPDNHYFTATIASADQVETLDSLTFPATARYQYESATGVLTLDSNGGANMPINTLEINDTVRITTGGTVDYKILSVLTDTIISQTYIVLASVTTDIGPIVIGTAARVRENLIGVDGVNTNFQLSDVGNQISIDGKLYTIQSQYLPNRITIFPPLPAVLAPTNNFYGLRRNKVRSTQARNKLYFCYKPPVGIFDLEESHMLGAGEYKVRLTPASNWKTSFVQSLKNNAVYGTDFNIRIEDVKFYYFADKSSIPDDSYFLHLNEVLTQAKPYANSLQFSIPSSSFAISVFIQSNAVFSNTKYSQSLFKTALDEDLTLTSIQLTYAGITKTATSYQSDFTVPAINSVPGAMLISNIDLLQQRYAETYSYLNNSYPESFKDYLKNGAVYHFDFSRDASNKSTEVQLLTTYKNAPVDAKLFLVAWYRNTVSYTTSNGSIVSTMVSSI
jgi:hypothetical protein